MEKKITIPNEILNTFILLKDKGYTKIEVSYSGSGDSGAIDDINVFPNNNIDWVHIENLIKNIDFFTNWLYEIIEEATENRDWWNDDGGYGNVSIDLNTYELISEYNERTSTVIYYENNLQLSV